MLDPPSTSLLDITIHLSTMTPDLPCVPCSGGLCWTHPPPASSLAVHYHARFSVEGPRLGSITGEYELILITFNNRLFGK